MSQRPTTENRKREERRDAVRAGLLYRIGVDPKIMTRVSVSRHSIRFLPDNDDPSNETRRFIERIGNDGLTYSGYSLIDLCREACELSGREVPYNTDELIQRASSTMELGNIFTTAFGAQLLATYEEHPDSTAGWTKEADVPNFQTNERHLLGKSGGLDKHARGGKANHMSRSSTFEAYKAARYSKRAQIDEMDFIDDNVEALRDTPIEMGRAAAQLRPDLVYSIMLSNPQLQADSKAVFHVDHNNLFTGAALAAGTLQAGIAAMGTQQQSGRNLDITPEFLIVPQNLSFIADQLISSSEIRGDAAANGTMNAITARGLKRRADSRIDNGVRDPDSGTLHAGNPDLWFLAGGRNTIEVGYVKATGRKPVVRTYPLTGGQWGIGWDVKLDIGAKALDYRGLQRNEG